jgi:hypothetical protein
MISKIKKIGFAVLITVMSVFAANAQNANPKVIALVNKASWCPVCKANGPRFEKDIMPMVMGNKDVQMAMNDLSDDNTKAASKAMIDKAGIASFCEKNTATGMLYFLDAKSKKLLSKVSLADSDEQIKKAYEKALAKS